MGSRHLVPYDTVDEHYATDPVPGILQRWNICAVTPLTELTHTRAGLRGDIQSMRARDNTYIPTGLMWGWRILSPHAPFTAATYAPENKKVLVLMTDGLNSLSPSVRSTPRIPNMRVHRGSDTDEANDKTVELCANIADEDIIIYTIAFEVVDVAIRDILQDCAANGGQYFDASNASELQDAFDSIADDLQVLRISR